MVNIDESNIDESTICEYALIQTIEVKCKQCRKTITDFSNVKSVSRRYWCTSNYMVQWNINFYISIYGEIFCECSNYLGYESDINEWMLLKNNVVFEY